MTALRVHFLGNTCNNHFLLARHLRRLGVDAHLFYNTAHHFQTLPESEDPSVAEDRPAWLHPYTDADVGPTPWDGPAPALADAIGACDLIHAEDVGLLWAAQSGRPYVWYPYGYDLNKYAFASYWRTQWTPDAPDRLLASVAYRRAIAGADEVLCGLWYQPLAHGWQLLGDLLPRDRFTHDIQLALDTDRFRPATADLVGDDRDAADRLARLLRAAGSDVAVEGLRLFQPARVMFSDASYVNKANDRLFRALARYRAAGGRFTLVLVRRDLPDEERADALFAELGIADRIAWVPVMPRHALVPWYQASQIVADEFIGGTLGSVSFEALGTGNALLTRLALSDPDPTYWPPTETFPEVPPVLNASTEDEILRRLLAAWRDPAGLAATRTASRQWAERWVAGDRVAERLRAVYDRILRRRREAAPVAQPLAAAETPELASLLAAGRGRVFAGGLEAAARALDLAPAAPSAHRFFADVLARGGWNAAAARVRAGLDAAAPTTSDAAAMAAPGGAPHATVDAGEPGAPSVAPTPVPSSGSRARLLAIADTPGWIFERHVRTLQHRLADEFAIDLAYRGEPFDEAAYDLVYPLEYDLVPPDAIAAPWKYVTGLRSHVAWDGLDPAVLARYLGAHMQRTHVVSERLRTMFAPHLADVDVVAHGFDAARFTRSSPFRRQAGSVAVGWAGNRHSPVKGFAECIAPLADEPGVELAYRGFADRRLSLDEMPGFYAGLDVYVCASSTEGHNNSLVEAAAMGCAIVTTDVGTVPEYLEHGRSALIVARSAGAIRDAVRTLRDDPALRERLGRAAAAAAHARWTWERKAETYRAFFREALASRDAARVRMRRLPDPARRRQAALHALDTVQRAVAAGDARGARAAATRLVTVDPTAREHRLLYAQFAGNRAGGVAARGAGGTPATVAA